jgi:hypothetical protein
MMRFFLMLFSAAISLSMQTTASFAQLDPLNPVPGGANGATVYCIQAGDLNSGAFTRMFMMTAPGIWEELEYPKPGVVKLQEKQRGEEAVDLYDPTNSSWLQFDFVTKRVKTSRSNPADDNWTDAYHILNATDADGSADCVALAALAARNVPPGPGVAPAPPRDGSNVTLFVTIRPGTTVVIPSGTHLTATSGPPCPGNPGHFLCPNKFSCAPIGGVCCPGAGSCAAGFFCDRFIPNSCISPASISFCKGTGDPKTGISLHCAPGIPCTMPGATCP